MRSALTYAKKNKLLLAGAVILLLMSWPLAFSRTYDAIVLNSRLKKQVAEKDDLSYNPVSMDNKLQALNVALERFCVDSTDWKDDFWLNVSRVASSKDVDIVYEPRDISRDSSLLVLNEIIQFTGKYRDLVLLLDSLERVNGIGRIGALEFTKDRKAVKQPEHIALSLRFYALNKQKFKEKFQDAGPGSVRLSEYEN